MLKIFGVAEGAGKIMSEQEYFKNALSDFTYEAASGGAIRHLADLGYTVKQITENLTYPTPCERVRRTVWKHLIDTGVILTWEPEKGGVQGKAAYMVEHGKYGKASFRLEAASPAASERIHWKERYYSEENCGSLAAYLADKCSVNGDDASYITCDFGIRDVRDSSEYAAAMQTLNERQREYIEGLLWEDRVCYHRLNQRMREIIVKLYANGYFHGYCYFVKQEEKVKIG